MSKDPILLLAEQRIISASAQLEVELSSRSGFRPTLEILRVLRKRAATSLAELATADLFSSEGRRQAVAHQNEVKRYDEWFVAMQALIAEGQALDAQMMEDERQEIIDTLSTSEEGQQELLELGLRDPLPTD